MTLQAIVSKTLEWQILQPSNQKGKAFFLSLHQGKSKNSGVQSFFIKIEYPEIIAFMTELAPGNYPAKSMIKRFGQLRQQLQTPIPPRFYLLNEIR